MFFIIHKVCSEIGVFCMGTSVNCGFKCKSAGSTVKKKAYFSSMDASANCGFKRRTANVSVARRPYSPSMANNVAIPINTAESNVIKKGFFKKIAENTNKFFTEGAGKKVIEWGKKAYEPIKKHPKIAAGIAATVAIVGGTIYALSGNKNEKTTPQVAQNETNTPFVQNGSYPYYYNPNYYNV